MFSHRVSWSNLFRGLPRPTEIPKRCAARCPHQPDCSISPAMHTGSRVKLRCSRSCCCLRCGQASAQLFLRVGSQILEPAQKPQFPTSSWQFFRREGPVEVSAFFPRRLPAKAIFALGRFRILRRAAAAARGSDNAQGVVSNVSTLVDWPLQFAWKLGANMCFTMSALHAILR